MSRSRMVLACLAALGLSLTAAACGGSAGTATPPEGQNITLTVGVAESPSSAPLWLGMEKGIFERHGIQLEKAPAAHGATAIAQLINGQLDVALGGMSGVISAVAEGIPVRIIPGGPGDHPSPKGTQYQMMVPPDSDVQSFRDLEGKTVAINSLNCCWEFWTKESVTKDGGDPNAVRLVQITFPNQVVAMKQGHVDAVLTLQPYATQLRADGYRSLGDPAAIAFDNPENVNTYYFMAKSFIDENPGVVERWRDALAEASEYANSHPEETRQTIVEVTGASPELVAQMPLPKYTATIQRDTIERGMQFLVKYGVLEQAPPYSEVVWQGPQQ